MRQNASRRRDDVSHGPTPDEITDALDALLDHGVPGTPRVGVLKTLEAAGITPTLRVHDRVIRGWSIESGNPTHGAMRSDDHVGHYEVEYTDDSKACPECGSHRLVYDYSAYHNISGSKHISCTVCHETVEREDW